MKLICHEGNPAQRLVAVDQTDNSVPEKNIKAKFCLGHPVQKKLVKLLWSSLTSFSFGEENANLLSCQDCRSVTRSSGVQEVKLSNNSERLFSDVGYVQSIGCRHMFRAGLTFILSRSIYALDSNSEETDMGNGGFGNQIACNFDWIVFIREGLVEMKLTG